MWFEKWHALGNDYLILEAEELTFPLSAGRIRALCAAHTGIGADGVLLLSPPNPNSPAAAHLRIFNPDGSEAELSGNGAREAVMYLHRRGHSGTEGVLTLDTAAGPVTARIRDERTCSMALGRARLQSEDFPEGRSHGRGELSAGGRTWAFQHVQVGNPQCAIHLADPAELRAVPVGEIGPAIEHHALFPRRTNVSWYVVLAPDRIRARIFERGVGETAASGTGASGAAVAHVLRGGRSPVTVVLDGGELEVEVGEDLALNLTGWAVPVFAGTLSVDFEKELHETE